MDGPIPKAQVANPEILDFTVLSDRQVQIHAKKPGITEVNLWDNENRIYTVTVAIIGDVRELAAILHDQFKTASIKLFPTSNNSTIVLSGYVDRPDHVNRIVEIAQEYYPKVINNMIVGGSQQVLLHVKVMQVSRTKLRQLGFDFMDFNQGNYWGSTVSGVITKATAATPLYRGSIPFINTPGTAASLGAANLAGGNFSTNGLETVQFGIINGANGFVGMLQALKQDDIIKVLSEPTLVTVSGRPAMCLVGGKVAYPQPTGFGNISVAFQPFGTQIDFVPIVLGNGGVRIEVRPQVSEVDQTLGTTINGTTVPGFRVRQADTGAELQFGQTLAIAGLLSQQTQQETRGVPYLMDVPFVGAAFRRTSNVVNEVELLITVRPELVEAMDPDQVPPCPPGSNSMSPDDCGLYWKGYREVPVKPPGGPGGGPGPMMGPGGPIEAPEQVPPSENMQAPGANAAPRQTSAVVVSDQPVSSRRAVSTQPSGTSKPGDSYNRANSQSRRPATQSNTDSSPPGLIGPVGYDVRN
jgi:pilus assembly protein CpaC